MSGEAAAPEAQEGSHQLALTRPDRPFRPSPSLVDPLTIQTSNNHRPTPSTEPSPALTAPRTYKHHPTTHKNLPKQPLDKYLSFRDVPPSVDFDSPVLDVQSKSTSEPSSNRCISTGGPKRPPVPLKNELHSNAVAQLSVPPCRLFSGGRRTARPLYDRMDYIAAPNAPHRVNMPQPIIAEARLIIVPIDLKSMRGG